MSDQSGEPGPRGQMHANGYAAYAKVNAVLVVGSFLFLNPTSDSQGFRGRPCSLSLGLRTRQAHVVLRQWASGQFTARRFVCGCDRAAAAPTR